MRGADVIELYQALAAAGVDIWIDGGWAVDALVGRQTRSHADLDIAIEEKRVEDLLRLLALRGYMQVPSSDASRWNFVVADEAGRRIDIHVVVLDDVLGAHGPARDGIAYPAGSLTGQGIVEGAPVRCVDAHILLQFKTSYPPRAIDRLDVQALAALLGRPTPDSHS